MKIRNQIAKISLTIAAATAGTLKVLTFYENPLSSNECPVQPLSICQN